MRNKKLLAGTILALLISSFGIYTIYNHDSFDRTSHKMMMHDDSKDSDSQKSDMNKSDKKKKDVIVTAITSDGYSWLHGDHSHFKKGKIPFDAKFLEKLVLKDPNYVFNQSDVLYEVAQGYIVKYNGDFYYYPKNNVVQTNIIAEDDAKTLSMAQHKDDPEYIKEKANALTSDGYVFNPADVVEVYSNGVVVRHGDHYHFIPMEDLNKSQLDSIRLSNTTIENLNSSGVIPGITDYTDDGFLFDGTNIVGRTPNGLIVAHGDHTHYIPYSSLKDTKFEYLIPREDNMTTVPIGDTTTIANPHVPSTDNNDTSNNNGGDIEAKKAYLAHHFGIDPSMITVDGNYLIVPHGDHSHAYPINEIDVNKPFDDPHGGHANQATGMETLKKLGVDDELIHAILHAGADTDFPGDETDVDKMKEWLKTVKHLNIGEIENPLKLKGLDLMPNIEVLGAGFTKIDDITPVKQFKKLKQLWIPRTGISDFSFLDDMPQLEGLDISSLNLNDLSFLSKYKNLKTLSVADNPIHDISVLSNLPELNFLNLDATEIDDISELKNNTKLINVSLDGTKVSDLSPLSSSTQLDGLFVNNVDGLDISTLNSKTLKRLYASGSNIDNVDFFTNIPEATEIDLSNNNIEDISKISTLTKLQSISFENNNISNISGSSNSLSSLKLGNNTLTSLEGIDKFTNLSRLDASNNDISTIDGSSESITSLNLNSNRITSLNGVNAYTSLNELSAQNNFIDSMALKEPNKTVNVLNIENNPLGDIPDDKLPEGFESFENVEYGGFRPTYKLNKEYIDSKIEEISNAINEKIKDEELRKGLLEQLDEVKSSEEADFVNAKIELDNISSGIENYLQNLPKSDDADNDEEVNHEENPSEIGDDSEDKDSDGTSLENNDTSAKPSALTYDTPTENKEAEEDNASTENETITVSDEKEKESVTDNESNVNSTSDVHDSESLTAGNTDETSTISNTSASESNTNSIEANTSENSASTINNN